MLRKLILKCDALFTGGIGLEALPCFLIWRASVDGRWRRDSFDAADSVADEMRILFYAWSTNDEKAVDMWSHLLLC